MGSLEQCGLGGVEQGGQRCGEQCGVGSGVQGGLGGSEQCGLACIEHCECFSWGYNSLLSLLAIGFMLGTKPYITGQYIEAILGAAIVVVLRCDARYSVMVVSRN